MSAAGAQPADAERIRELALEILDRPEFEGARGVAIPDPLVWLGEQIAAFLDWVANLYLASPVLYWLLLVGLLIVSVLLIAHIVWSISRAMRDSAAPPEPPRFPPPVDLAAAADALAREGRHLEAAHHLLLATLVRIAREGIVDLAPGDTNREVRARLREAELPPAVREEVIRLLDATERAWFRDRSADPELVVRWRATYARLAESGA